MPVLQSEAVPRAPPGLRRGNRCLFGSTVLSQPSMPASPTSRPGPPVERHAKACWRGRRDGAGRTPVLRSVRIRLRRTDFLSVAASCPFFRPDHRRAGEDLPARRSEPSVPAVAPAPLGVAAARVPVPTAFPTTVRFPGRAARRVLAGVAAGRRPAIPVADRCLVEAACCPVRVPGRSPWRDAGAAACSRYTWGWRRPGRDPFRAGRADCCAGQGPRREGQARRSATRVRRSAGLGRRRAVQGRSRAGQARCRAG